MYPYISYGFITGAVCMCVNFIHKAFVIVKHWKSRIFLLLLLLKCVPRGSPPKRLNWACNVKRIITRYRSVKKRVPKPNIALHPESYSTSREEHDSFTFFTLHDIYHVLLCHSDNSLHQPLRSEIAIVRCRWDNVSGNCLLVSRAHLLNELSSLLEDKWLIRMGQSLR